MSSRASFTPSIAFAGFIWYVFLSPNQEPNLKHRGKDRKTRSVFSTKLMCQYPQNLPRLTSSIVLILPSIISLGATKPACTSVAQSHFSKHLNRRVIHNFRHYRHDRKEYGSSAISHHKHFRNSILNLTACVASGFIASVPELSSSSRPPVQTVKQT